MRKKIFLLIVVYLLAVINVCASLSDTYDHVEEDFVVSYKNKSKISPSTQHPLRHHRHQQHHQHQYHQQYYTAAPVVTPSPQNRTHVYRTNPHRHHKTHNSHTDNYSGRSIKSGSSSVIVVENRDNGRSGLPQQFTTKSPIQSVRNFLSSREHDQTPHRRTHRLAVPTIPPHFTRSITSPMPSYYYQQPNNFISSRDVEHKSKSQPHHHNQNIQRANSNSAAASGGIRVNGNKSSGNNNKFNKHEYDRAKEKTFDEIAREISLIRKRKRHHRTTTTTTSTTTEAPITPGLDGDYDNDDDYFQDDVADYTREDQHDDTAAAVQSLSYQKKVSF